MNRTNIEWTDFTWNPVTGCSKGCDYCYARRMAYRQKGRNGYDEEEPFKSTFHGNRLLEPYLHKKPSMIFTCSMGDLFDDAVPSLVQELVFQVMRRSPDHTFQVLTKRPENIPDIPAYQWPRNLWLGVTVDGKNTNYDHVFRLYESTFMGTLFVSFEPLLGPIERLDKFGDMIDWAIVGALSRTGNVPKQPNWEWVKDIIHALAEFEVPLFMKNNLELPQGIERVQKYPLKEG